MFPQWHDLYYCGRFTSKRNEAFLVFTLPLSPMCAGHISLFESTWQSHRRIHVTLEKIDVRDTILVQTRYPSSAPVLLTVCSTYYEVNGDRQQGYSAHVIDRPGRFNRPDCRQKRNGTAFEGFDDPSACQQTLIAGFERFLNRAFRPQVAGKLSKKRRSMSAQCAGASAKRLGPSFSTLKTDSLRFRDFIKQAWELNPSVQDNFCCARSRQLLFRSADSVAVDVQADRQHIKYVTHNKDFYDAFVVVNDKAWNSRQEILVCTSFPDDQEHEWTLEYCTCTLVSGGRWQINPQAKSTTSILAVQATNTFQQFLNQRFIG